MVPIVLAGVGAGVAVGVGLGLLGAASGKASDAQGVRTSLNGKSCVGAAGDTATACAQLIDAERSHDNLANGSTVALIAAGGLAAVTVGLLIWEVSGHSQAKAARIRPVPWISATSGGASVVGRF